MLRAITIPVAGPVDATWGELVRKLHECWNLATVASNWAVTELRRMDGEPIISVELGAGDRWHIRLQRGKHLRRQLGGFRQLVKGDALRGELALVRRSRDGAVLAKLVMWATTQGRAHCRRKARSWCGQSPTAGIEFPWWDPTVSHRIAEVEHSGRMVDGGPVRRCDIL